MIHAVCTGMRAFRPLVLLSFAAFCCFLSHASISVSHGIDVALSYDAASLQRIESALQKIGKWDALLQDFGGHAPAIHTAAARSLSAHISGASTESQFYTACTSYRSSPADAEWLRNEVFAGASEKVTTFHMSAKDDLACFLVHANPEQVETLHTAFTSGRVTAFFPFLNEMKLHDTVRSHALNLPMAPGSTHRLTEGHEPHLVLYFQSHRRNAAGKERPESVFGQVKSEFSTRSHLSTLQSRFHSLGGQHRATAWGNLHTEVASRISSCDLDALEIEGDHAHLSVHGIRNLAPGCLSRLALALASHSEVLHVTYQYRPQTLNNYARGITQTSNYLSHPYTDLGLTGAGQVVGIADDGLDDMSCFFIDTSGTKTPRSSVSKPITEPDRRKVVQYIAYADSTGEVSGHGTHTSGSVAGNCINSNSTLSDYNGQGQGAKLAFFDIGVTGQPYLSVPPNLYTDVLMVAYNADARIHSDSWGSSLSFYDYEAIYFDEFLYDHPDFTAFIAAGNQGQSGYSTVGSPATGKNVITVGAGENDHKDYPKAGIAFDHTNVAYFSSVGPTFDNRFGVDIVCPGFWTYSANGSAGNHETCSWILMAGTSMATPTAAGTAAAIREYFASPTFWAAYCNKDYSACQTLDISGVLLKAIVLHSGEAMAMYDQPSVYGPIGKVTLQAPPDIYQGYGLMNLDNVLPLPGVNDGLDLYIDDLAELAAYTYTEYRVTVTDNSMPLKITVAWYDPINTVFASKLLLHDLDLIVKSPSNVQYLGNAPTDGFVDEYNPHEQVYVASPEAGTWKIYVSAKAITESATQKYSLTVTSKGEVSVASRGTKTNGMFDNDNLCGSTHTLDLSLFDYNADGWSSKTVFGLVQRELNQSQVTTFEVVNSGDMPQIHNADRMCVEDNKCYLAVLEMLDGMDMNVAVEIPECNVFLNSWINVRQVCMVNGVCNPCNATDTTLTLKLEAVASQLSGWGMNYFSIFTDHGGELTDSLKAAGTMEWVTNSTLKTVCLPDGDYIVRLHLNDPLYFPILSIDECDISLHTTVSSLSVSEGSVQASFSIKNGKCNSEDSHPSSNDDDDDSGDKVEMGAAIGIAAGALVFGALVAGLLVFFLRPGAKKDGIHERLV